MISKCYHAIGRRGKTRTRFEAQPLNCGRIACLQDLKPDDQKAQGTDG